MGLRGWGGSLRVRGREERIKTFFRERERERGRQERDMTGTTYEHEKKNE